MEKVTSLIIAFVLLSAIFSILESLFAADKEQKLFREGYKTDLIYWFYTPIFSKFVSLLGVVAVGCLLLHTRPQMLKDVLETRQTWVTTHLPHYAQLALLLLVSDITSYWTHRLFHGRKLWKFHAVHHCSEKLDWLSSVRLHPVNDFLSKLIQAMVLVLCGFSTRGIAAYLPFLGFYAILIHANVTWDFGWLGQVIASPRFHRWHHTSQEEGLDKNFAGLFPWIDRIFGTYYMPKGQMPTKFGLYGEKIPGDILGQMLYPFRKKTKRA